MKRLALMVIMVLALAAPAFAQTGSLGVFSDDQGNSCNITDIGGGAFFSTYIVHKFSGGDIGATGCRFKVVPPAGSTWNYFAFTSAFTTIGGANTDLSVGYGGCQTVTFLVGSALWQSVVAGPPCSYVTIEEGLTGLLFTDCNFGEVTQATPGKGIVNPTGGCQCNIAVQPATWGQVKALYR